MDGFMEVTATFTMSTTVRFPNADWAELGREFALEHVKKQLLKQMINHEVFTKEGK